MPRSSGTMTIVNSFTPSTTISSSQVNANFTDIATEITNSLALDGQSAMSGQLKAADGIATAPGITFGGDLDTGFYRSGANTFVAVTAAGTVIATFSATGIAANLATLTTRGDMLRRGASASERLALGASGLALLSDGTDPGWAQLGARALAIAATPGMALIGGYVAASVASNILTVAIKTTAGADPATATPVICLMPDETIATGAPDLVTISAATSLAVPDTATLGTANSTPFALYVVLFNDGALGVVNCRSSNSIIPLDEGALYSATAVGTGADSAQVIYSTAGHTNKPFRIVARLTYASGLATAGTWASAPTRIEQAFRGMKLPGDIVQSNRTDTAAVATGTTVTDDDDSIPQVTQGDEYMAVTITPRSAANMLRVQASAWVSQSGDANITGALHKNDGADAIAAVTRYNGTNAQLHTPMLINYMGLANSAAATEFQLRVGPGGAATVTLNGVSGGRLMGGVFNSYMTVEEIQG